MNIFGNRKTELQEQIKEKDTRILELENALKKRDQEKELLLAKIHAHNTLIEFFDPDKRQNETERKKYVSDVALSYVNVFKKKFPEFIFDQQQALSIYGKTQEEYDIYRCNINVIRLFEEWMITLTNEHMGDLEEARMRVEETDEFTSQLRETYDL